MKAFAASFRRLLWYLSKSDPAILAHCGNHARMTQESFGFGILVTGTWALLALSYAAYTVFGSMVMALGCGLLYACLMMWFDREVVSAFGKGAVWTRLPIAVLFGMIVAIPLELLFFEDRIMEELRLEEREKNGEFHAEAERLQASADQKIELYDGALRDLAAERDATRSQRNAVLTEMADLEQTSSRAWELMGGEEFGIQATGLSGLRGRGPNYNYHRRIHDATVARLEVMAEKRQVTEGGLRQIEARLSELVNARDGRMAAIENEKREMTEAAQRRLYVAIPTDLLARFEALWRLTASSFAARVLALLLWSFFVLLETSPALLKLYLKPTEYHWMIEAERVKNANVVVSISNDAIRRILAAPGEAGSASLEEHLRRRPIRWAEEPGRSGATSDASYEESVAAQPYALLGPRGG